MKLSIIKKHFCKTKNFNWRDGSAFRTVCCSYFKSSGSAISTNLAVHNHYNSKSWRSYPLSVLQIHFEYAVHLHSCRKTLININKKERGWERGERDALYWKPHHLWKILIRVTVSYLSLTQLYENLHEHALPVKCNYILYCL